jgi:hypothetical protein
VVVFALVPAICLTMVKPAKISLPVMMDIISLLARINAMLATKAVLLVKTRMTTVLPALTQVNRLVTTMLAPRTMRVIMFLHLMQMMPRMSTGEIMVS